MKRPSLTAVSVTILLLGLLVTAPTVTAQDGETDHPVVGTWAAPPTGYVVFGSDGSVVGIDPYGSPIFGNWQSSGDRTADFTIRGPDFTPGTAPGSTVTARGTIEVGEDGTTAAIAATVEFSGADGSTSGQLGPLTATFERLTVEPMGEPVGPLPSFPAMPMSSPMPGASPSPDG